jgi:excisionase family DNA binding protein
MVLELLTKQQVAEALGVSTVTLDRLRQIGDLHCRRIGGRVRFTPEDVKSYIERAESGPWVPQTRGQR